MMTLKIIVT